MNSTLLRTIAILLGLGGLIMAWLGYRMSAQSAISNIEPVQVTYPQLVAARDLAAGQILKAGDVQLEALSQRDPYALTSAQQAVGKLTLEPIAKGTPVLASYFPELGPVAQSLKPQERAVAIKANEVVGVGGFVNPGDYVDVLLYLRAESETGDTSSAQVILSNVRVLAYGDEAEPLGSKIGDSKAGNEPSMIDKGVSKFHTAKARDGKSAILAVPEQEAARLLLAENSGILRLALRGAALPDVTMQQAERHFVKLESIGKPTWEPAVRMETKQPITTKSYAERGNRASESQVIVHRGDEVEIVKVKP